MPKTLKARGRKTGDGGNRSQAIRDTAAELGGSPRPRDVIAALSAKGIQVSPALVTNVLTREAKRKAGGKSPGRKPAGRLAATATARSGQGRPGQGNVSHNELVEAKRFVAQMGSVDGAKRALDALAQLQL